MIYTRVAPYTRLYYNMHIHRSTEGYNLIAQVTAGVGTVSLLSLYNYFLNIGRELQRVRIIMRAAVCVHETEGVGAPRLDEYNFIRTEKRARTTAFTRRKRKEIQFAIRGDSAHIVYNYNICVQCNQKYRGGRAGGNCSGRTRTDDGRGPTEIKKKRKNEKKKNENENI